MTDKEKFKNIESYKTNIMKTKIMYVFLFVFLLSTISAYQISDYGDFERNSEIRLTQICDNSEFINLTSISYPNSTIAENDIQMNEISNGEFYYDFNKTSVEGTYHVRGISDGCEKNFAYTFEVIPEDKGVFNFNFSDSTNLAIYTILFLLGLLMGYLKHYEVTSITFIINGFFMMVNDINIIASIVVIMIGVVIAFYSGREE